MDLRPPPRPAPEIRPDRAVRWLLAGVLVLLAGLGALVVMRSGGAGDASGEAERIRRVASQLKAAGVLDEAAAQYERFLAASGEPPEVKARIAYSLGTTYMERGRYESALRWFYEAEALGAGDLAEELGPKIVHSLERLGRHHAAQAALDSRVRTRPGAGETPEPAGAGPGGDDPVVARIGSDEIRLSELRSALDDLPPQLAAAYSGTQGLGEFLEQHVADELLWRKAAKLEYDRDPEVLRRHGALLKQLAVARFVEREMVAGIEADEADLRTFFEAHRERYKRPAGEGESPPPPTFEEARPAVERDYRLYKLEAEYRKLIDSELSASGVELFPERIADAG